MSVDRRLENFKMLAGGIDMFSKKHWTPVDEVVLPSCNNCDRRGWKFGSVVVVARVAHNTVAVDITAPNLYWRRGRYMHMRLSAPREELPRLIDELHRAGRELGVDLTPVADYIMTRTLQQFRAKKTLRTR